MKSRVFFICAAACFMAGVSAKGDSVTFTLSFTDRAIPDKNRYEALQLTGDGFKRENDKISGGLPYEWYGSALKVADVGWKLTYDGYADVFSSRPVSVRMLESGLTANVLTNITDGLMKEEKSRWEEIDSWHDDRKKRYPYQFSFRQLCPSGSGYTTNAINSIVWHGLYYDLVARYGTEDAKKRILVVSSEYEKDRRLCLGWRVPTLKVEKENAGFHQIYTDGVGGEKIAELHVKYPGGVLGGSFHRDRAEWYFKPHVLSFVVSELMNPGNRGKTIKGRFVHGSGEDRLVVEGRNVENKVRENVDEQ